MEFRYNGQVLGGTAALSQGMTTYSEEETLIGTYNGKPLYRKVVSGTIPTQANTWSTFASNAIGSVGIVDQLTLCMGVFYQTGNTCIPMPNKLSDTHWIGIYYDKGDDRIGIVCGSGYATGAPGIVILEYTKTTDPEGTVTPLPVNCVQSYDTEDGWHVRKYSDGYVEMTHISGFSVEKSDFHDWGSAVSYDDLIAPLDLPVPLLDKFYESGSIMRSVPNSLIVIPRNTAADIDRAKTSGYGVFNMNRSGLSDQISGTFSILVTGRWK